MVSSGGVRRIDPQRLAKVLLRFRALARDCVKKPFFVLCLSTSGYAGQQFERGGDIPPLLENFDLLSPAILRPLTSIRL